MDIGDDSFPLLMQPLLVGFEQDWSSVSPSAMLAWVSALMLCNYAYHAVCTNKMFCMHNICDCLCENQPSSHHKLNFFSVQLVAMYNS